MNRSFLRTLELPPARDGEPPRTGHPWGLPVVAALREPLALDPAVTFLVGENGSGKSMLVEALAIAVGLNPEGGTSNFGFATREEPHPLGDALRVTRGLRRPRTDFFLRAESLFNAATYLDGLTREPFGGGALDSCTSSSAMAASSSSRRTRRCCSPIPARRSTS